MSFLEIFRYTRLDTAVHRLDPRSKLVASIVLATLSLLLFRIVPLLLLLLTMMPILALAKSLRRWWQSMRGILMLIAFIVAFNTLLSPANHPLSYSVTVALRLVALMTSFSIFFLTVHPDHLSQALIQMHVKFEFAFAMSMAMRYVPTLAQEAHAIMDAQRARGVELDRGSPVKRIRNTIPILVPLIVVSIRRALAVAESMESRGFGSTPKRTYMEPLRFTWVDSLVVLASITALTVVVALTMVVTLPDWMLWELPL
ncbi:MAG: energy-coupling factor transporter transmembrane component T [Candidatus Thorarchaeota archaeon]